MFSYLLTEVMMGNKFRKFQSNIFNGFDRKQKNSRPEQKTLTRWPRRQGHDNSSRFFQKSSLKCNILNLQQSTFKTMR